MDIVVYRSESPWATPKEDAFIEGLRVHGIEPEERSPANIRASDLAVIWAHRHKALFDTQRQAGAHYLVMERGYIGDIHERRKWTSLGFDGLNGRAWFPKPVNGERWERNFGHVMQPWKDGGEYTVVMGQVRGDASLGGLDVVDWYDEAVANMKADWKFPVVFRPHPRDDRTPVPLADRIDRGELSALLEKACGVCTFNSNTGVDAVLAGAPVVARDRGSMAWDVSGHDYDQCWRPDRTVWAAQLAFCQWTDREIASGLAWDHLRKLV